MIEVATVLGLKAKRLKVFLGLVRTPEIDEEGWAGTFVAEVNPPSRVRTAAHRSPREVRLVGE